VEQARGSWKTHRKPEPTMQLGNLIWYSSSRTKSRT